MTRPAKQVKWQHYSNNNEAIKRAKKFFTRDLSKAQLIIARVETVSSPRLDTAPGGGSHGNSSEDSMIRAVMARQLLKEIDATLDAMNDEDAEILRLRIGTKKRHLSIGLIFGTVENCLKITQF